MNAQTHNEPSRDQIEMGKIFAEMMNLLEDTRRKEDEREKMRAETARVQDERDRMRAETLKLQAEAMTFKFRHFAATAIGTVLLLAALRTAMEWFAK